MENNRTPYKVILLGDPHVGKSCIYEKILNEDPTMNPDPTIGANYCLLEIDFVYEGKKLKRKIELWDTAGQERYRSLVDMHFRNSHGALIVYDVTKERSFRAVNNWLNNLKSKTDEDVVIALIGNKIDLAENDKEARRVEFSRVNNFKKKNNINMFFETSAVYDREEIMKILRQLLQNVYKANEVNHHQGKMRQTSFRDSAHDLSSLRGSFSDQKKAEKIQKEQESGGCC